MTKKTSTAKFTLMLIAVLMFVFAGVFCASVFSDGVGVGVSELNVAEAGSNSSGGTEYKLTAKGNNNILSGINNSSYWWDYQVGGYGGVSAANAHNSKYGWYYKSEEFSGSRDSVQASMIYLRLPSFMTTTKATINITLSSLGQSTGVTTTTYTLSNVASEIGKRTTSFSGSGLYWKKDDDSAGGLCNYVGEKSFNYSKSYENLGIGNCISLGIWSEFNMESSGGKRTRTVYCLISAFTINLEGDYNTGTIKYNANTGSGTISDLPITYGNEINLSSGSDFSKTGYRFIGWNTAADGSGESYSANQKITNNEVGNINLAESSGGTTTLYAQWEPNTGSVKYNANGGSNAPSNTPITYNTGFTLSGKGSLTKSNCTLIGWDPSSTASVPKYALSGSVAASETLSGKDFDLSTQNGKEITLYAVWKESDFNKISGGTGNWGSKTNPYVIATNTHLSNLYEIVNAVRDPVDSVNGSFYGNSVSGNNTSSITYAGCYFVVTTANITAKAEFAPIGKNATNYFGGTIYGGSGAYTSAHTNRTITLSLSLPSQDYVGLCGHIKGTSSSQTAGIENITIAGSVSGKNYVAGFAGVLDEYVLISNCTNTASITSAASYAGGIAGFVEKNHTVTGSGDVSNTKVNAVSNSGTIISGSGYAGGIVGRTRGLTFAGAISNSGNVGSSSSAKSYTGGIVGQLQVVRVESGASFTNTGAIYGAGSVGGIAGNANWCVNSALPASTNNGTVTGTGDNIGGIIGYYESYANVEITWPALENNGAVSATGSSSKYVGGIFGQFISNSDTSYQKNNKFAALTNNGPIDGATTSDYIGGIFGAATANGSNIAPVFTFNAEVKNTGWVYGRNYVGGLFGYITLPGNITTKLTNNISTATTRNTDADGVCAVGYCYGGISGYMDYNPGGSDKALIKCKVTVSGKDVDGNGGGAVSGAFAGALVNVSLQPNSDSVFSASRFSRGTKACTVNGVSYETGGYAGGIVGIGDNIELIGIAYTGGNSISVTRSPYCGGIIAYAKDSVITDCHTATNVGNNGTSEFNCQYTGGIAGYCTNTPISKCYYNGTGKGITGSAIVGGIVGWTDSTISHCYNLGSVTTETLNDSGAGGIAGYSTADISYCYNQGSLPTVMGLTRVGGIAGYSNSTLTYCYSNYPTVPVAGTDAAFSATQKAWNIGTAKDSTQAHSKAYRFTAATVIPVSTNSVFTDILTENIQKLKGTGTTTNGTYVSIINDSSAYPAPETLTNETRGTDVTSFRGASADSYTISAIYNFASAQTSVYIFSSTITPSQATGSSKIYDMAVVTINATNALVPSTYKQNSIEQNGKTVQNQGSYSVDVNILNPSSNTVLGTININYTISRKDISNGVTPDRIRFGYLGSASNNGGQFTVPSTSYKYYKLNALYEGTMDNQFAYKTIPAIIYSDSSYNVDNFTVFDGTAKLVRGTDFTVSALPTLGTDEGIKKATSSPFVTLTGTGNYTGTYNVWFTLMKSDFDILSGHSRDDNWGSSSNPYVISAPEHMIRLSSIVNRSSEPWDSIAKGGITGRVATTETYGGSYFLLANDITLTKEMGFVPVGRISDTPFRATEFNGNSNTITITYAGGASDYIGIFGYVSNTNFVNINTAGTVSGKGYVGALAGYLNGRLNGTINNSATVTGTGDNIGGVVGYWKEDTQTAASVIAGLNSGAVSGANRVAGFVGALDGADSASNAAATVTFNITQNNGTITATGEYAGGIAGYVYNFDSSTSGVKVYYAGCVNTGSVSGKNYVGGIVGKNRDVKLYGCVNGTAGTTAKITATGSRVGGIIGEGNYNNSKASNSSYTGSAVNKNYMAVSGSQYVGGCLGYISWGAPSNLENNGTVTSTSTGDSFVGGCIGNVDISSDTTYNASGLINTGSVNGKNYVGGIIGRVNSSSTARKIKLTAVNSGAVSGAKYVGGITGYVKNAEFSGTLTNGNENTFPRITGTDSYIGGIAGYSENTNINGATLRNTAVIQGSATSDYVGGLFGYLTLSAAAASGNFESYGTYIGRNYVAGIAGYINTNAKAVSAKFISKTAYDSVTYSIGSNETAGPIGAYGSNIFGYAEGNSTVTFTSGSSISGQIDAYETNVISRNCGIVIGGIAGANINLVLDLSGLGNFVSGFSIIGRTKQNVTINGLPLTDAICAGAICGFNSGTIKLPSSQISCGSIFCTADGNYIGGLVGYNTGSINNVNVAIQSGHETYRSNYVGGIAGYNSGTVTNIVAVSNLSAGNNYIGGFFGKNEAEITSTSTINHTAAVKGFGTTGYVGGFAGYSSACITLKNFTQSGNVTSPGSYVGGIFGYTEDAVLDNVSYANTAISGVSYVGGIAGYLRLQNVASNPNSITTNAIVTATGSFVGGYAGYMTVDRAGVFTSFTPVLKNGTSFTVQGKSYVGAIFGYFVGGGYKANQSTALDTDTVIHISSANINVKVSTTSEAGDVIGGLFGFVAKAGIIFDTNWNTSYAFNASSSAATLTTNDNYVGGIAGIMGENAALEWNASSSTATETIIINNTQISSTGSYIGGVVGYISPYAGAYVESGVYKLGNLINLKNSATISGNSFVGGFFGAVGDNTLVTSGSTDIERLIGVYKNATSVTNNNYVTQMVTRENNLVRVAGDNNYFVFDPSSTSAINLKSISATGSYAGGFAGYVGLHARFNLENSQIKETSLDTNIVEKLNVYNSVTETNSAITAGSYAGGFAGYLSKEQHTFTNLINKAKVGTDSSTYVGGLVGYAEAGTFTGCVCLKVLNNNYLGTDNVGGLIGYIDNGTIESCYTEGFAYMDGTTPNTSYSKGGVVGFAGPATLIKNSWTFYTAKGITYSSNSANNYGKYVLIEIEDSIQTLPSACELCVMSGLLGEEYLNAPYASATYAPVVAGKGLVSFSLNVALVKQNTQLAFYGTNGSDTVYPPFENGLYDNALYEASDILYVRLNAETDSIIVDSVSIDFRNIPLASAANITITESSSTQDATNFVGAYSKPSSYSEYFPNVYTATYDEEKYISTYKGTTAIRYNGIVYPIGRFDKTATQGDESTPYIINDSTTWKNAVAAFASRSNYSGKIIRVSSDFSISASELTSNLFGSSSNPFSGTFDGDGHRITVTGSFAFSATANSIFPSARGTIKNLTITSENAFNGSGLTNIAVFVGQPSGNLVIENCINEVSITNASCDVGGFVGYSGSASTISLITCVNKGSITSTNYVTEKYTDVAFGTGGIIGRISESTTMTLDSCKNEGRIQGGHNVGGICGITYKTLNIYNCANTGEIWAVIDGGEPDSMEDINFNRFAPAGGILGKLSGEGTLGLYSSYNSGQITTYANYVGGLVGCIGDITIGARGSEDTSSSKTSSYISYCYNTGLVQAGGTDPNYISAHAAAVGGQTNFNGSVAGGIVGVFSCGRISYCYNTGRIISWSGVGYGEYGFQYRVAGIAAQMTPTDNMAYVDNCYNVGHIEGRACGTELLGFLGSTKWGYAGGSATAIVDYGGAILGYIDNPPIGGTGSAVLHTSFSNNYTLENYYYIDQAHRSNPSTEHGWANSGVQRDDTRTHIGTVLSLDKMTAYMTSAGLAVDSSFGLNFGTDALTKQMSGETYSNEYRNGTLNAWVRVYGCLPQLATFAVDTKESLAMTSKTYGQDIYGLWHRYTAGAELSPYVVKDGIDLLGVQALTNVGYTFQGKYISTANVSNNIAGTSSGFINLAYNKNNEYVRGSTLDCIVDISSTKNYSYQETESGTILRGKSYHLYANGAICNDSTCTNWRTLVSAGTAYTAWKAKNSRYNGTGWSTDTAITDVNFYPIGASESKYFGGTIDGTLLNKTVTPEKIIYNKSGNSVIRYAEIYNPTVSGLFGYIQDATVSNIVLDGTVQAMDTSSSKKAIAGVVGVASGSSIIDGCQAGSAADKLSVTTVLSNESYTSYTGGIVGEVLSGKYNGSAWVAGSGLLLKVQNCISNADVTTAKSNAGGIIGYAANAVSDSTNGGNQVFLINNNVKTGNITAASKATSNTEYGTAIGGIAGASDGKVNLTIQGCTTGNNSCKLVTTQNVIITGENKVGGIIGYAPTHVIIGVNGALANAVYGDTLISRGSFWGTVSNNGDFGTSIGGFTGYAVPSADINVAAAIFAGQNEFYGHVLVTEPTDGDGYVEAVGGLAGYLGTGATFREGCVVQVGGIIEISDSIALQNSIGGVSGIANGAAFSGVFRVSSEIIAERSSSVGGFIGTSKGQTEILAGKGQNETGSDIVIAAKISAVSEVGGFVGEVLDGTSLNIGSDIYGGNSYAGKLSIDIKGNVTIYASGNLDGEANVGGIVGLNDGNMNVVKGTIINNGAIIGGSAIPDGYKAVDYIQSDGSAYIKTGLIETDTTTINCDVEIVPAANYLFGARQKDVNGTNMIYNGLYNNKALEYNWKTINFPAADRITMIQTLSGNVMNYNINGTMGSAETGISSGEEIYIFACNNSSVRPYGSPMKLYSFSISDNGIVKRNYIPCVNPSGVAGLYDTVTQSFYSSSGSSQFTEPLPAGYQAIEYLESDGSQYINTGVAVSDNNTIELKVYYTVPQTLYGCVNSGWSTNAAISYAENGYTRFLTTTGLYNLSSVGTHEIRQDNNGITINGHLFAYSSDSGNNATGNLTIFRGYRSSNVQYGAFRLYYFRLYSGGSLVRDMIPCINPSGEAGLYDTLNGTFYGNAGAGSFNSSVLPDGYKAVEYIQTTGSQYINTGYVPNNESGFEIVLNAQDFTSDRVFIGQRPSTDARMWIGGANSDYYFGWNTNVYAGSATSQSLHINTKYTFGMNFLNNRTRSIDGTNFGGTLGTLSTTTYPILIGAAYNSGSIGLYSSSKIYSVKISQGNTIAMNLVPCINSSGTAGFYDTVGNSFYSNAGSGTFGVGPIKASSVASTAVKADNAGGFIGLNAGNISFDRPVITNLGSVSGGDNVGGIVGYLKQGTIAGTFTNGGAVSGLTFVGGSIGRADGDTVLTTPTHTDGATVTPTAVSKFENSGIVIGQMYVGGSVGALFGEIKGYNNYNVYFNNGNVVATEDTDAGRYVGGSFGIIAGKASYASFDNAGRIETKGETSIGGSIGLIGFPQDAAFTGISHREIEITNCHFEFTSESGLNVGPDTYDSTDEGGVGGIIGVLYNVAVFDQTNTFFVLGSVHAPNLPNVGGSIGIIHGGNAITINGLLAYKTNVEGYQNVGGILGAIKNNSAVTISNSYNVSVDGEGGVVASITSGKVYGGIVGLAPSTTVANSSYWIKGFPNEQLASLNINNVKSVGHNTVTTVKETFPGHYVSAGDAYITYNDTLNYYARGDVYTVATGVTAENYTDYYIKTGENTYAPVGGTDEYSTETVYYEKSDGYTPVASSTVNAENYRGYYVDTFLLSSSYVDTHSVEDYITLTGQSITAASWESYMTQKYNSEINDMTIYLDGNRNWVRMVQVGDPYTTGTASTGYYFLYANDTGIRVTHTEAPAGSYTGGSYEQKGVGDTDFWKRIANSYTTAEINDGKNTAVIRSEIAPDLYPQNASGTNVTDVKSGGTVQPQRIYAKAASNYRDGFFLYMKTTTNEGMEPYHETIEGSKDFYITANLSQGPENVVLFYRTVGMGSSLTYNGNERFAPITLNSDEIGYIESVTNLMETDKVSKYYYTVKPGTNPSSDQIAAYKATNVGHYVSDIVLYYYDATGKPYEVGSVVNGEWSITERELKIAAKQKGTAVYNGTATTGEVQVSIDNFCIQDAGHATIQIIFTAKDGSVKTDEFVFTYQLGTGVSPTGGHSTSTYITNKGSVNLTTKTMSGNADTGYNLSSSAENKTYSSVFSFTFTNALKYQVTVDVMNGTSGYETLPANYKFQAATGDVEVQAKQLHVGDTASDTSANNVSAKNGYWDGSTYTKDIYITGWATSDSSATAREKWFTDFYPYWQFENGEITYFKTSTNGGSTTDATKSLITSGGASHITIQGYEKGSYKFGFNSSKSTSTTSAGTSTSFIFTEDGNYKIQLSPKNPQEVLVISPNELKIAWSASNKTYNGSGATITATITATHPLEKTDTWTTLLDKGTTYLFEVASKVAGNVTENACEAPRVNNISQTKCEVIFTTNKNADTYVAKITGPDPTHIKVNCPVTTTPTDTQNSRDYWTKELTISKAALTVTYEYSTGSSPYVYNTSHQGVTRMYLTGFVSGEDIENTGAYGKGNGTGTDLTKSGDHASTPSSSSYNKSDNGYTLSKAINVGTYTAKINITATYSNYSVSTAAASWSISPYEITLGTGGTTSSVYTGRIQSIEAVYNDPNLEAGSTTAKRKYYTDELEIRFLYATEGGSSDGKICNVGKYNVTINSTNSVSAKNSSNQDVSFNYTVKDGTAYKAVHEITAKNITVTFSSAATFVYKNQKQGPVIASNNLSTTVTPATDYLSASFAGLHSSETITVNVTGSGMVNAGNYTANTNGFTLTGNNEAGASTAANYTLTAASKAYEIQMSRIKVTVSDTSLVRVYDGTTVAKVPVSAISLASDNGGAALPVSALKDNSGTANPEAGFVYGTYDTKNVGKGKTVTFSVENTSTQNYVFINNTNVYTGLQIKTGEITRKPVYITMNLSRNKATKVYDGNNEYAVFTNGNANNRSVKYKSGQGFTVNGVVAGDDVIITAVFKEADTARSYFDAFINNVTREGTEGSYTYVKTTDTFKNIVFTVSSASTDEFMNYSVAVNGFTNLKDITSSSGDGNVIYLYDSSDTNQAHKNADTSSVIGIEITAKTITASYSNTTQSYANEDNSFNHMWKAVTGKSSGIITGDGVTFAMINGWMYKDGTDRNPNSQGVDITQADIDAGIVKEYQRYTTVRGSASSNSLRATLVSANGRHLNYILRQQPTLTIGYFPPTTDGYEISSFAGLMLASYYYSTNFMEATLGDDDINTATLINTWNLIRNSNGSVCSWEDYENNANIPTNLGSCATWDEYFDKFIADYNSRVSEDALKIEEISYEDGSADGAAAGWGYWVNVKEARTSYLKFRQTRNISAVLTANDIAILNGQFGSGWGAGSQYLSNFIKCGAGEVCVAVNAVFPVIKVASRYYGFLGEYYGNGFIIDNLTIMANNSPSFTYGTGSLYAAPQYGEVTGGVGMFALVNSSPLPDFATVAGTLTGYVTGVNIRNAVITVADTNSAASSNTLYIGGLIGVSQMTRTLANSSFHGTIVARSNGAAITAGGLIGLYSQPGSEIEEIVKGSIITGAIHIYGTSNVTAGGLIGKVNGSSENAVIKDIVSMTEIIVTETSDSASYIGALAGYTYNVSASFAAASSSNTLAYLTNATLKAVAGSETLINKAVGNGSADSLAVTYDALRSGSGTGYNVSHIYSPSTMAAKQYDVMNKETVALGTNDLISTRLVDIIDIYLLLFSLGTSVIDNGGTEVEVTTKLDVSPLTGKNTGSAYAKLPIANQQQVSLLRVLPFAAFELKADVKMYRTHKADLYNGYFHGSITNSGSYTIDLIYATSSDNANRMFRFNSGTSVPCISEMPGQISG